MTRRERMRVGDFFIDGGFFMRNAYERRGGGVFPLGMEGTE